VLQDPLTITVLKKYHPKKNIRSLLERLRAVIKLPKDDQSGSVRIGHAAFADFLTDKARCLDHRFLIDPNEAHGAVFKASIHSLDSSFEKLGRDIRGLGQLGATKNELDKALVRKRLPPSL
jgi:hypothetical protein